MPYTTQQANAARRKAAYLQMGSSLLAAGGLGAVGVGALAGASGAQATARIKVQNESPAARRRRIAVGAAFNGALGAGLGYMMGNMASPKIFK